VYAPQWLWKAPGGHHPILQLPWQSCVTGLFGGTADPHCATYYVGFQPIQNQAGMRL